MNNTPVNQKKDDLEDNSIDVLLDIEDAIRSLTATVDRILARGVLMEEVITRLETRAKRTESRLCQLMHDQGSDIHIPPSP